MTHSVGVHEFIHVCAGEHVFMPICVYFQSVCALNLSIRFNSHSGIFLQFCYNFVSSIQVTNVDMNTKEKITIHERSLCQRGHE